MFLVFKKKFLYISLICIISISISCVDEQYNEYQNNDPMIEKTIEEVIEEYTTEIMVIPGVVGIGQGICDSNPCIKVLVLEQTPELDLKIPDNLEGYKVAIKVSGRIEAE